MDSREALEALYRECGSLPALGRRLGMSASGARRRLMRAGVPIRDGRRTKNPAPTKAPDAAVVAEWQGLYDAAGSVSELARRLGLKRDQVEYRLRRLGVPIQTSGYRSPRTVTTPTGPAHFNWRGGRTMHSDGYVLVYAPWHPAAQKGYVLEHRLVMEEHLGRYLTADELVHHRNEVKTDNRVENLVVTDTSAHMSHHKAGAPRDGLGRFAGSVRLG